MKFSKVIPPQYEQYWNLFSKRKGSYSGVGLFTRIKPIRVIYGIQIPKHDQEGRVITAEFE